MAGRADHVKQLLASKRTIVQNVQNYNKQTDKFKIIMELYKWINKKKETKDNTII